MGTFVILDHTAQLKYENNDPCSFDPSHAEGESSRQ